MSKQLNRASMIAVAAMFGTILVSAEGSGAAASESTLVPATSEPATTFTTQQIVQQGPEVPAVDDARDETPVITAKPAPARAIPAASLARLVAATSSAGELSRELGCLAGAIYFESKSESLAGQLAVGRVVVARSKSGRFPNSYCGVVFQPSQFSFVRGNAMPAINRASQQWRNAVAIARIAHEGSWRSPAEGALFFHAARVSPGWRLTRLTQIDNHIFYR